MRYLAAFVLVLALLLAAPAAEAGCRLTVKAKNGATKSSKISRVLSIDGWVRVKMGTWKKMFSEWQIPEQTTRTKPYKGLFGCDKKRRYKFTITCQRSWADAQQRFTIWYPSKDGWTTDTFVDIGERWLSLCE